MASLTKEFEHLEIKLEDIKLATDNFNEKKVIGKGGFGKVYKGELSLSSGKTKVAFKRLDSKFGQGGSEFVKEIKMLSCYTHENLISLLGFCSQEEEMILIYEFAARGSLDHYLKDATLTWKQRIKICLDAAKGLKYLHDPKETYQRIIHCDIKSANILLDENFNSKVSDFGLSKISPANQQNSMLVTNALGTLGYCDPVFMETYCLTKESDVYSFGVVLFEVLCGRLCVEYSNLRYNILVRMWKKSYKEKKLDEIVFQDLKQQLDPSSLETFADIAYQCLQNSREQRPAMSHVVEKLKSALELQEVHDMTPKLPKEYAKIVRSAVDRLTYTTLDELKAHLSKWVILNGGKTLFSINDKGEHCERICIEGCLDRDEMKDGSLVYPFRYNNSRFLGRCYEYTNEFKARVRADFLSPKITYTVNLVFRCKYEWDHPIHIRYKLDGETKLITVCKTNQGEDGWFMAELHQCNSEHGSLEIMFERCQLSLLVAGIEFQPFKEKVEDDEVLEYQDIIKAASPSLAYRSIAELKMLLSKGFYLNEYKRWFSLNENGDNCEMISVAECLIIDESNKDYVFHYEPHYLSRFPAGPYKTTNKGFRVHVKTQFLSPLTTYTVNLVFSYPAYPHGGYELEYLGLQYKLEGETETSTVYFADCRKFGLYWAELYQFTSDGRSVDLVIVFEETKDCIEVEGIMFQPLEKVDNQQSEDAKVDTQTVINSEIMKVSKDSTEWTTKKDRYSFLCQCFRNENSQELYSVDKNGKKCLKLSAQEAWYAYNGCSTWESSPDSSFGEVVVVTDCRQFIISSCIKSQVVSPETKYACYLVYKLPQDQSALAALIMEVTRESDSWYIHLRSPPNTPVIGQKLDKNTHNSLSRPSRCKRHAKPQHRSDGWMEVKLWEFRTLFFFKTVSLYLSVRPLWSKDSQIILEGIELRPV